MNEIQRKISHRRKIATRFYKMCACVNKETLPEKFTICVLVSIKKHSQRNLKDLYLSHCRKIKNLQDLPQDFTRCVTL